jgi:uncharacterized cupin superfamily protein
MMLHVSLHRMSALQAFLLAGLLTACEGTQSLESRSSTLNGAEANAMIVYSPRGQPVDEEGFVWLGPPEGLGGRVLEGDPKIFARLDYSRGPVAAGLFKATTGKLEVTFPFTEHATILEGEVHITDGTGQSHLYKAGDSYFIRQGQVLVWDVKGKQVIKSFFNTVESQ